MPFDNLARAFASLDLPLPGTLSSGAPHYTLPPHSDARDLDIDTLTVEQANALHKGAVPMRSANVHMKAHG